MVCLPDCWREAKVTSWVDPSLHVGQPYIDHLATVVRVQARIKVGKGGNRLNLARIDAAALIDPANRPHLQRILSAAPKIPWNVTADAHAALLVGYLQKELSETFAPAKGRPRQTYISDETWTLRGQVAALRKRCARLRKHCRMHLLVAAFRAWAARDAEILHTALCSQWALQAATWGQAHAPPLLLGGKKGASAVFGSHAIRLFCKWATTNQLPACVLFADVASAYYNSVRDLTARRVDAQGCSVSTYALPEGATAHEGLLAALQGPSAFEAAGAPAWLESLASEMHRGSWFTLRGDHVPVTTRRGSQTEVAAALPLVCSYKHLGVLVGAQGKLRAYRCRRISVSRRGTLLASMVLPRLLFGAGAWPCLKRGEAQLFQRTVMSLYRQTLCVPRGEDQHISGATTCALLRLADPQTLLQVERLRYLRQLVQAAPDAVWALVRQDASYIGELRAALRWLYRRISATVPLPDPLHSWPDWSQVMCASPGRFRGWIKRASSLEALRLRAFAAFQSCRRFLTSFCPDEQREPETAVRFSEACLPCRKAFVDRVSWACHASRLHGYRTRATELTRGVERAWCSGCGKLFANASRMKRHVFVTQECQRRWGTFHPAGPPPKDPLHPSAPPMQLPGLHDVTADEEGPSSGTCHPALLEALLGLDDSADDKAWEAIQDFIAPIEHLRCTVSAWKDHPQAQSFAADVAGNMILLLDPEVCCEVFHRPKQPSPKVDFLAPLTFPAGLALPLASHGAAASFSVEEPPLPSFVYPFDCSAPLAPASRQIDWLEASIEVVVAAVQTAASAPVRISASGAALRGLEPFTSWLCKGGMIKTADGLVSS
ncbi:Ap1g1 [Symbiodinium necroappetens]|uniref:Ap1g1 protein n=1 Tax=Symbiodinium necroappetens TaxID=1628268 RepID=A0A812PX92_9DINO|nr:Ap1g1 [Symbiodinium necroappetens]